LRCEGKSQDTFFNPAIRTGLSWAGLPAHLSSEADSSYTNLSDNNLRQVLAKMDIAKGANGPNLLQDRLYRPSVNYDFMVGVIALEVLPGAIAV
jgi:hypothetical protein